MIGPNTDNEFVNPNNKCSNCEHPMPLPETAGQHCPECGTKNPNKPKPIEMGQRKALECYECGKNTQYSGEFCIKCGSRFIISPPKKIISKIESGNIFLKRKCLKCEASITGDSKFCTICGQEAPDKIMLKQVSPERFALIPVCNKCNLKHKTWEKFCKECGEQLVKSSEKVTLQPLK